MALIGALLLSIVLSTALGSMLYVSAIERRAAAAYRTGVELRAAAEGTLALVASELGDMDWNAALTGSGSAKWMSPQPGVDPVSLTGEIQAATVMASSHGADTPVWRVFAHTGWPAVTGQPGRAHVLAWVADDWQEADGNAARDSNQVLLIRAVAVNGRARAWAEAACGRAYGRVTLRHVRSW